MDLGKAKCHRKAATNWFHHNQGVHHDYGLVWHNGKCVYLSKLQFLQDQPMPKALSPPLRLGQFDNVQGVCWSKSKSDRLDDHRNNHLCVQHADCVSIWVVFGRYPDIKCKKQTEFRVKVLPQGCLWHPTTSILCVLSDREFHTYNAQSVKWETTPCDGKISAGCWLKDGSKFILALGSELKVFIFNMHKHTLDPAGNGSSKQPIIHGLDTHMSIKTIVPVTKKMVAIATDLPLDSLICQSQPNLCRVSSMKDRHLEHMTIEQASPTNEFPLIIPRDCIIKNPVAEILKEDKLKDPNTTCRDQNVSTDTISKASPLPEEKQSPSADTLGDKLDQILNLMKTMDVMPDVRGSPLHQKNQPSKLSSKVESKMQDSGTNGPIDITGMINESQSTKLSSLSSQKVETAPDITDNVPSSSSRKVDDGSREEDIPEVSNTDEVIELVVSEIQERQSGPVDVTALLGTKSVDRTEKQLLKDSRHGNGAQNVNKGDCDTDQSTQGESTTDLQESDDIIDLTNLKANMTHSSMPQMSQHKQKRDINDTAKLSILHVTAFKDPITVTSVDLPGILTPDLLYYQEETKNVVVGTNTQKQLLVYRLQANTLEPAKQKITLPESHRPLGICSIPQCPTGLLVLAGKSISSTTDGAFLSFSGEVQLDLKLFSYQLQSQLHNGPTIGASTVTDSSHTSSGYSEADQEPQDFPGTSQLDFQTENTPEESDNPTPIKLEFDPEADNVQDDTQSEQTSALISGEDCAEGTAAALELTSTDEQVDDNLPNPPVLSILHSETPSQTVSPTIISQITHEQTAPRTVHRTVSSNRPWSSAPRFRAPTQRPWASTFAQRAGQRSARVWQVPTAESSSIGRTSNITNKYPYPEDADLLHLICEGLEDATPVWKTFLLNQQMLKLQVVKDAFGLDSVEMKIRDNWVVLTDDSDGFIPVCFSPNTSHTIKGSSRIYS